MAPPGKSRARPSCLSISTGSNLGASQAIRYTVGVPLFSAAATGEVQLERYWVDPPTPVASTSRVCIWYLTVST
eukprot:1000136-Pyramimonas_sp.AAC.2